MRDKEAEACTTRVELIDFSKVRGDLSHNPQVSVEEGIRRTIEWMKQAGCYAIAYGIESASQVILDALKKDISIDQIEEAIHLTRRVGLQTIGYFMIGSPGESVKTIEFAKKLKLDFAQFAITIPYPGTELYRLYMKENREDIPWQNFRYDRSGYAQQIVPMLESNELSKADLQYWVKQAYKQFYLRPAYIWQKVRQSTSPRDLIVNLKGFFMLLGNLKW